MTFDPKQSANRVERAVRAAGTDPWLVGYDANGIQEFIAASSRPIAMRGASEAILDFDGKVKEGELAIFAGGGRGVVLARSHEDALRRARALVDQYRTATRGEVIATSQVPLARGGDAEAHSIRWLRHRLEIAKDEALPPRGELPDDKDRECACCRRHRGTQPSKRDDETDMICLQCEAMLANGRNAGRQPGARRGEMSRSIAEIATNGWIATLSADGNNLGTLFESLGTLVELAVVSEAVAETFQSAQKRALDCIPDNKRVPLLTGGDDVRAFMPPAVVLSYVETLVEVIETTSVAHARAARTQISEKIAEPLARMGIGIGAVIANVYYPAWRLVDHAHALEVSAKAACRAHGWRSGFDFAVVTNEDAMAAEPSAKPHVAAHSTPGASAHGAITSAPARTPDARHGRALRPGTEDWRRALRNAAALAKIPSAQIAIVAAALTDDRTSSASATDTDPAGDGGELGNLLRYQVARSEAWRRWYETCGVDWRDRAPVFEHRPTRGALELVRLLGFREAAP